MPSSSGPLLPAGAVQLREQLKEMGGDVGDLEILHQQQALKAEAREAKALKKPDEGEKEKGEKRKQDAAAETAAAEKDVQEKDKQEEQDVEADEAEDHPKPTANSKKPKKEAGFLTK